MGVQPDNVILLSYAKAIRDTLETLHSPYTREIIHEGAAGEFKRLIAPVIKDLLNAKGADEQFQTSIISLLEKVYAAHHIDADHTKEAIEELLNDS